MKVGLENVDTKYVQKLKDTFKLLRKNTSYEFFPVIQCNVVAVIAFWNFDYVGLSKETLKAEQVQVDNCVVLLGGTPIMLSCRNMFIILSPTETEYTSAAVSWKLIKYIRTLM